MDYSQHRNHMNDGSYPVDHCYWCHRFVIEPAERAKRGQLKPAHNDYEPVSLDIYDNLAAEEEAA